MIQNLVQLGIRLKFNQFGPKSMLLTIWYIISQDSWSPTVGIVKKIVAQVLVVVGTLKEVSLGIPKKMEHLMQHCRLVRDWSPLRELQALYLALGWQM